MTGRTITDPTRWRSPVKVPQLGHWKLLADLSAGEYLWTAGDRNRSAFGFLDFTWLDLGPGDSNKGFAPVNLSSLSNLEIEENKPNRSVVGELNATDPDGHSISYVLVSGVGDENNSFFF